MRIGEGLAASGRLGAEPIERALATQGRSPQGASLEEMDALWNEAKKTE